MTTASPLTLLVDTAAGLHLALLDEAANPMAGVWEPEHRAGTLGKRIEEMLTSQGKKLQDLQSLWLGIGPGSFTGLRVGMAYAQGLSLAGNLPIYPFPGLKALLWSRPLEGTAAVMQAKRGYCYVITNVNDLYAHETMVPNDELPLLAEKVTHCLVLNSLENEESLRETFKTFNRAAEVYHYGNLKVQLKSISPVMGGPVSPHYVLSPAFRKTKA